MMDKVRNFTFVFYLFLVAFQGYSQTKTKEVYTLFSKEKVKYVFNVASLIEKSDNPSDTIRIKFTFSLLMDNQEEILNENMVTFRMKYTKPNSLVTLQNLPDNVIAKLGIASSIFPPNYETFCREKILKSMLATFRLVESNNKLKKVGFFE